MLHVNVFAIVHGSISNSAWVTATTIFTNFSTLWPRINKMFQCKKPTSLLYDNSKRSSRARKRQYEKLWVCILVTAVVLGRLLVVSALPSLQFLDSQIVTEADRNIADDRQRSSKDSMMGPLDFAAIEKLYPTQIWHKNGTKIKATTASSKYGKVLTARFRGGHSEGNRFIRNSDL